MRVPPEFGNHSLSLMSKAYFSRGESQGNLPWLIASVTQLRFPCCTGFVGEVVDKKAGAKIWQDLRGNGKIKAHMKMQGGHGWLVYFLSLP